MINKGYLTAKTNKQSDEYYTPDYAVIPILKYLKPGSIIWCPFDTKNSSYSRIFQENGFKVITTHIDNGENFFFYEPDCHYDVIISNPPFSCKDLILKRLQELGKPYAILLPLPTLQGQSRFEYLINSEVLVFNKRINFYLDEKQTKPTTGVSFASVYVCKNFLPEKLIFEKLDN